MCEFGTLSSGGVHLKVLDPLSFDGVVTRSAPGKLEIREAGLAGLKPPKAAGEEHPCICIRHQPCIYCMRFTNGKRLELPLSFFSLSPHNGGSFEVGAVTLTRNDVL